MMEQRLTASRSIASQREFLESTLGYNSADKLQVLWKVMDFDAGLDAAPVLQFKV
jgi:hypothetical protein